MPKLQKIGQKKVSANFNNSLKLDSNMYKAKSKITAEKTIFAAFNILKDSGGELRGKYVIDKIRKTVEFNEHEKHKYEITGHIRWESVLNFYTVDCIKAGYLRKLKGVWMLTSEGEEAIKLGPSKLLSTASKIYREWDANRKKEDNSNVEDSDKDKTYIEKGQAHSLKIDQLEEIAISGVREFILQKNAYEFQDLVAALLNALGYHISKVSYQFPDSGIDLIAYNDPLGTTEPRIIVQIKHQQKESISIDEIQKLAGTLKRSTDVGIFITSGYFSKLAEKEARLNKEHIELIGFDRFVALWTEHYEKLKDEQKSMMPLKSIAFLGKNE
jgi:restriction system protein